MAGKMALPAAPLSWMWKARLRLNCLASAAADFLRGAFCALKHLAEVDGARSERELNGTDRRRLRLVAPAKNNPRREVRLYSPTRLLLLAFWIQFWSADDFDIEGGASSDALPHCRLGLSPILRISVPPFAMSDWLNHGLSSARPFIVAD